MRSQTKPLIWQRNSRAEAVPECLLRQAQGAELTELSVYPSVQFRFCGSSCIKSASQRIINSVKNTSSFVECRCHKVGGDPNSATTPMINFTAPPLKSENLVEITMAVSQNPAADWPAAFNGVSPDARLNIELNNIGYLRAEDGLIYSCLAIQTNKLPDTLDGIARFDIAFEVVSLEAGTMRVLKTRPFNSTNALTQNGQTPSCSGAFETTTNLYTDVVQVGEETLRVVFELINAETLVLRLRQVEGL